MSVSPDPLRAQLVRILDWKESHVDFDTAVDGIPPDRRGARAAGFDHSPWELLEHMRIAQEDILDFCTNGAYVHDRHWPDDYWPTQPGPPSAAAWDAAVVACKRDREALKTLTLQTPDLFATVPTGKGSQTYLRAVLLVTDHNAYHVGQLVAVRRALGIWT
ncbi:MAG: DinB family protein [Acidobacteria bacterium]|nr:DinB family protein [Acidobacteriota bacterium]